jgi:DNA-binding GntR family transcriptional regulator
MIADEISTLGQQVYRRLYDRLMSGALLPGAKLTLRGLAEELGTSMQPIREAVSRLAAEGALELAPNRLIRVPCFSRAQTDELWSMRVLLEGYAAALFATRAESDEIARLVEINESLRAGYATHDWQRIMRDAQTWGLTLAAGARSPLFEATIVNLRLRSAPHLAASLFAEAPDDPAFFQFTVHIQDELVLAVRTRDAERARDLRRADLQTFQRYLYRRLGWSELSA